MQLMCCNDKCGPENQYIKTKVNMFESKNGVNDCKLQMQYILKI